ncbi:predicted protein [Naegleria gruberi]|uniref:Predicted protein n=1 Tax=Naegleria gruberi TaxID=5762 RepID=D2VS26_NAEGR|nr:uncharacterized protein NAEGRDRAFT_71789 [Naegleria gruberi]EFC40274.1 predicted protein [Naegleria gruberi]|eukprot:XP_002673018.1 predicted protein [Naegleria gruberi strain NEG-M]
MIITRDCKLLVCGENQFGQLGMGDAKNRLTLVPHEFFTDLLIQNNEFPIDIDGGISHTIVMTNKKRIFYFGNTFQACSLKPIELSFSSPKSIKCTNYATFVITERNKIFSCGLCGSGQIPFDSKLLPKSLISCNSMISLVELSKSLDRDEIVVDISGGSNHTCFHTNFGRVFICGKRFENSNELQKPILMENPFDSIENLQDYKIMHYYGRSSFFVTKTLHSYIVNFKKQLLNCSIFDVFIITFQNSQQDDD